jgi:hypothetical protein
MGYAFDDETQKDENILTPTEREQIVAKILTTLHAEIQHNPTFYHTLPKNLQDYFAAEGKKIGSDFDFFGEKLVTRFTHFKK